MPFARSQLRATIRRLPTSERIISPATVAAFVAFCAGSPLFRILDATEIAVDVAQLGLDGPSLASLLSLALQIAAICAVRLRRGVAASILSLSAIGLLVDLLRDDTPSAEARLMALAAWSLAGCLVLTCALGLAKRFR